MRFFLCEIVKMQLVAFSAHNYRSISKAYKLNFSDYSVILGPNNEGKSNILRGLALALRLLTRQKGFHRRWLPRQQREMQQFDYNWERDFPVNMQEVLPKGRSEFVCEFSLSDDEYKDFKKDTKINLTTNLKAKITIGSGGLDDYKLDFLMKGSAKKSLNSKQNEILVFLDNKLASQYIPSIRTSEIALSIVDYLLGLELSQLEKKPEFQEIIKNVQRLQKPIIDRIASSLKNSVAAFIPELKHVSIKNSSEEVARLINASREVFLDDGSDTNLRYKGDGVISLVAISLLQHLSGQGALDKGLILLVEEPESHLHPRSIHNLKKVLLDISKRHQVIVTTHSPILIERTDIKKNIIVQAGKANTAQNISEVRQSLGVVMSDNLISSFLVLLLEGVEDIEVMKSWLCEKSLLIKNAIANSSLAFDDLGGGTNVGYKTSFYKNSLCNVIAYLDNDDCGKNSIQAAIDKGILEQSEYILASCKGKNESEIEDLIVADIYSDVISDKYGVC